jgi:hypothetical protein
MTLCTMVCAYQCCGGTCPSISLVKMEMSCPPETLVTSSQITGCRNPEEKDLIISEIKGKVKFSLCLTN